MKDSYQALRDATAGIAACDELNDDEFSSMLDALTDSDTFTKEYLDKLAGVASKYKDDPKWKTLISAVQSGPDFSSETPLEQQFEKLIAALPANEQEAGRRLEEAVLG